MVNSNSTSAVKETLDKDKIVHLIVAYDETVNKTHFILDDEAFMEIALKRMNVCHFVKQN